MKDIKEIKRIDSAEKIVDNNGNNKSNNLLKDLNKTPLPGNPVLSGLNSLPISDNP